VVIHQPDFLPHPGFFERLLHADLWIVLDHVPFSRRGWVHRDRIRTAAGADWVTIPIREHSRELLIRDAVIAKEAESWWRVCGRLVNAYREAPCFEKLWNCFEQIISERPDRLLDLNLRLLNSVLELLEIEVPQVSSSDLEVPAGKSEMLAELAARAGATRYLSGQGAQTYHEESCFEERGVQVLWQDFSCPEYRQLHQPFVPGLSIVDVLFNCGAEATRQMLMSGRSPRRTPA